MVIVERWLAIKLKMKITNGVKPKQISGPKGWSKRSPNPTNFSNMRSHMYLTQTGGNLMTNGKTSDTSNALLTATSNNANMCGITYFSAEMPKTHIEEAKTAKPPILSFDTSTPAATHRTGPNIFPQTTKLRQPANLDEENAWKGETKAFWTERQTPRAEFCPIHLQKMEKLQPKQLPASNESLIDSSVISTSSAGVQAQVPVVPAKEVRREKESAKEVKVGICLYDSKRTSGKKLPSGKTAIKPEEKKKAKRSRSEQRKSNEKETVPPNLSEHILRPVSTKSLSSKNSFTTSPNV